MVRLTHTGRTLLRYRTQLAEQAEESAKPLWRVLSAIEKRWADEIKRHGENGVTRADVNRVEALLDRAALESEPTVARWFHGEAPHAALNGLGTSAAYIAKGLRVSKWADIPFERVRQTILTMELRIHAGDLSMVWTKGGVASRFLPADVLAEWRGRLDVTAAGIRDAMTEAVIKREAWTDVASRVLDEMGDLHISGQKNPVDFAKQYARTALTQVANDMSTASALEAGLTDFFNLDVPDNRECDLCEAATAWGSHTLEEWDASEFGQPGFDRHPADRCMLLADVSTLLDMEPETVGAGGAAA